jgi:Protein of unknown function (DUF3256)
MKQFQQKANSVIFTVCLLLVSLTSSGKSFEQLYIGMPDGLDPTLNKQKRLELLEYYKAHQNDSIKNLFNNKVILTKFDTAEQHLIVKNTSCSTFEMKLIQRPDSVPIVGIIHTVCGPICQSRVEFYDTAWHKLPILFKMPKTMDWVNETVLAQANLDRLWMENLFEDSYISLSFDGKAQTIFAKCNSLEYLAEENKKALSFLLINRPLVYKLIGWKWLLSQE